MRSSKSGVAEAGAAASARSRAGLSPGDQNPSRHSASGGAGTSRAADEIPAGEDERAAAYRHQIEGMAHHDFPGEPSPPVAPEGHH